MLRIYLEGISIWFSASVGEVTVNGTLQSTVSENEMIGCSL